jgi:hypothetical protein
MFCMGRYPGMIGHSMHRSLQLRTNLKKRNKDTYQLLKISTVYDVQCTMYSVQCAVYSVQCTVYGNRVSGVRCQATSVEDHRRPGTLVQTNWRVNLFIIRTGGSCQRQRRTESE